MSTEQGPARGPVLTLGEALIALLPMEAVGLGEAGALQPFVGGAEINFAIGVRRLGIPTAWVGRVGADPFGELVLRTLAAEGVDAAWARADAEQVTGVYFREWLADGLRRPYYYRVGSAASHLCPGDLPAFGELRPRWLHVTGITPALGPSPRAAAYRAVEQARAAGIPISLDPNFRPALWTASEAREALLPLARRAGVLLMSRAEAAMLLGTAEPAQALERAHAVGVPIAVVKLGADGALASADGGPPERVPPAPAARVLDPVGAGDGFDAGFVAALLSGSSLRDALAVGAYVGARAVESVGEHGYPRASELPPALAAFVRTGSEATTV